MKAQNTCNLLPGLRLSWFTSGIEVRFGCVNYRGLRQSLASYLGSLVVRANTNIGGVSVAERCGNNSMRGIHTFHNGVGSIGSVGGGNSRVSGRDARVSDRDAGVSGGDSRVVVGDSGSSSVDVGVGYSREYRVEGSVGHSGIAVYLGFGLGFSLHNMLNSVVLGDVLGAVDSAGDSSIVVGVVVAGQSGVHTTVSHDGGSNIGVGCNRNLLQGGVGASRNNLLQGGVGAGRNNLLQGGVGAGRSNLLVSRVGINWDSLLVGGDLVDGRVGVDGISSSVKRELRVGFRLGTGYSGQSENYELNKQSINQTGRFIRSD